MIYLQNERLKIEIQEPGLFYRGSRFDWTGFISQITLDDAVNYCVPEQLEAGKGSGGLGFCNEFGIDQPIGYDQLSVGELFPKIGIGLLKKDQGEVYDFFRVYDIRPSIINIDKKTDCITFETNDKSPKGYGYHLLKEIRIIENRLIIKYQLTNTGQYLIQTNEYSHNFIGINNQLISKHYHLWIPGMEKIDIVVGTISRDQEKLTWPVTPDGDFYALINCEKKSYMCNWELFHDEIKAGVKEISQFEPSKVALWGFTHVVCPEVFIEIKLEVNEQKTWERVYEFYQSKET